MSQKSLKIVHFLNPFKCLKDNPSYLYYAQPITFQSMLQAKLEAQKVGIDVTLAALNYPEDDVIVPDFFLKLPHLQKSTLSEFPRIAGNRKLPIIQEMFTSILKNTDADYFIFTNSDIGVQKNFYKEIVNRFIKEQKLECFIINRRDDLPKFKGKKRLTANDLSIFYKEKGVKHGGKDCFIMKRSVLEKVDLNLMFTGYPPWGSTLHKLLQKVCPKTRLFENEHLTFHLGNDRVWRKSKTHKLREKNKAIAKKLLS